ncbi:MAG: EamA family transporter [Ornithinimicrobium sp.]
MNRQPSQHPAGAGRVAGALTGALLVVASTASVQGSAALASGLFDRANPLAVTGLRQAFGALALILLLRPRLRGRSAAQWRSIGVLAVAMATMNSLYYLAVDVLPLGVAATLFYLGPFVLAARNTPRGPELLLPVVALGGVYLATRAGGPGTVGTTGVLLGLAAGAALAAYTLASQKLGRAQGLDSLTLAVAGSALLLLPASIPAVPGLRGSDVLVLVAVGAVGVTVTYGADFLALQISSVRLVSVLFALDPVMGVFIGAAFLAESLQTSALLGVAMVVVSGACVTAITARSPADTAAGRGTAERETGSGTDSEP